jgi:AraC family ethanolamine operon transcriptional activator
MQMPAPAPAGRVRRTRAADVDEHIEQIEGWQLRYEQLDQGRFSGEFTDIRWPGVQVFVEKTGRRLRQRGQLAADCMGVALLMDGEGEGMVNAVKAAPGTFITCHCTELDICTPPACTLAGVVLDASLLRDALSQSPSLPAALRPGALLQVAGTPAAVGRWRDLVLGAVSSLAERPQLLADHALLARLQQDLLGAVVDLLSDARCEEPLPTLGQRKRIVDRACELMLAHTDEPLSLAQICLRVGASPRKLDYCFQHTLGMSPARYLQCVRLNAVRRELARTQAPCHGVYDVAARWGFWHFGHFSGDYKKQFAELPSETLQRGRRRQCH